ncbi:hypothetical protein GGI08_003491 [Coemansia sp. S2]|nr:hypothetical protein GGH13_008450 [Coemansia sp. S155-1]KAJ2058125.1 hypothetical protein GGI08_003491 [Coemansia sp. S2]
MLQDLRIGSGDPREVIYDNDNNAVTYPNLQHLQITNDRYFDPKDKVLAPGIVPFPKLKSLHILMDYVFADDVMFRGNSNTLEHLEFHVDEVMMDTMINSEEFKNVGKFLMKVVIVDYHDSLLHTNAPQADATTLLSKLAGNALILGMSSEIMVNGLLATNPRTHEFKDIQLLNAMSVGLSVFQIMNLLKILPALKKLCCASGGLGRELTNIAYNELPDHILSKYSNIGKHFYKLQISSPEVSTRYAAAEFIMTLALACPKLCRITSFDPAAPNYRLGISEILESDGPYSKYAPRFRRLLKW